MASWPQCETIVYDGKLDELDGIIYCTASVALLA